MQVAPWPQRQEGRKKKKESWATQFNLFHWGYLAPPPSFLVADGDNDEEFIAMTSQNWGREKMAKV